MQDQSGITTVSSSFTNGRISCSFTRTIAGQNVTEDRNLDEAAYVLLAYGNTRGIFSNILCSYIYTKYIYTFVR